MAKQLGKLAKVNENININRYDNGWMVEVGGRDDDSEWKTAKILCNTEDEMLAVVKEWNSMPIDN
jgi:glycine cleavage system H lipoate-binding protein